jgi:hypothetical protein
MATDTKPLPEIGSGADLMAAPATGIRSVYQPIVRRRFDFALTHDRELVTEVARSMMRRLAP